MNQLKEAAQRILSVTSNVPFSVYSSVQDQHLTNVPIVNPLLICVLGGSKELGRAGQNFCQSGEFVFLSNTPNIDMRNVSQNSGYFALLIEFQYSDFSIFTEQVTETRPWFTGKLNQVLLNTLRQFVEWAEYAPQELWSLRRQELLQLIYHLGYTQVCAIAEPPSVTHKVEKLVAAHMHQDIGSGVVAQQLAMSESTLRRKLSVEETSFQSIKDRIRLGYGLHLLQTTDLPIGRVAEETGYLSQSRFTDKFKSLFGLTPSELRNTRTKSG